MKLPVTAYGSREITLAAVAALSVGAVAGFISPWLIILPALGFLYVLSFFRDPERRPAVEPLPDGALLSPADGRVDFIGEVDEPLLGGRCLKVSIFLSVFDVHLNRAPAAGRVERIDYRRGEFLDARRDDSGSRNEANALVFSVRGPDGAGTKVLVRQVSGAIARRIVCAVKEGQTVDGGERIGMIKFGSRTDLCVPLERKVDLQVRLGQHVSAGRTVMGVLS